MWPNSVTTMVDHPFLIIAISVTLSFLSSFMIYSHCFSALILKHQSITECSLMHLVNGGNTYPPNQLHLCPFFVHSV